MVPVVVDAVGHGSAHEPEPLLEADESAATEGGVLCDVGHRVGDVKVAGVLRQCQAQLDLAGSVPDGVGEGLSYQTHEGEALYRRPRRVATLQDLRFGKHGADPAP